MQIIFLVRWLGRWQSVLCQTNGKVKKERAPKHLNIENDKNQKESTMMRFILSLCSAVVLCGAMSSPLLAAPGHAAVGHGAVGHGAVSGHGPARVAGFGAGHYPAGYVARDFRGPGNSYFDARYRTQFFYYPAAGAYYYWGTPGVPAICRFRRSPLTRRRRSRSSTM